jgi:WXXGXW repeat (2 copies)
MKTQLQCGPPHVGSKLWMSINPATSSLENATYCTEYVQRIASAACPVQKNLTPPRREAFEPLWSTFRPQSAAPFIRATRSRAPAGKRRVIGKRKFMRSIPSIRSLIFVLVVLGISAASYAQVGISVTFGPPELPVYEQPPIPGAGYIWTPGYWAWSDDVGDYYWVPGTWVMAPEPGLLWTPAYWGWEGNAYLFHEGYWGPQVGFYGGISYGYGYTGEGYEGGRWQNGQFYYNQSVNNVNVTTIRTVYNAPVKNTTVNRVSYNGGNGGVNVRPTPQQEAAAHQRHVPPVAVQTQHAQAARSQPELRATANHGKPPVAATPKAGAFKDRAVVAAKQSGPEYHPPANRNEAKPRSGSTNPEQPNRPSTAQPRNQPEPNRPAAAQPNNQPESNRPPAAHPNDRPEPNRPPAAHPNDRREPNRPPTAHPNDRPESNRPPAAHPNDRPEPNRAPAETKPSPKQQQEQKPKKPEEKKRPEDQGKPQG